MTPRRDTFARLGVEPLEARTLLHAGPVDTNAFALWEDADRNTEVAEYRVMAEHTQAVVDNTSKTLHAILGGMPALDAAVSQAQNTTGALRQSVDLLRGSASATDTSLSQLQGQRKDIAQHLADIDASTHTLQEQLNGEQAALHTLQKQEDSLLKERGALRTTQDELQTANAQTLQTMAGLSRTIAELQQHMETQTACMTALEASLTSARAELQALHSSIATMDTELHALSQNVTATTEQQTFLEAEHARLTGEIVTQDTVVSAAKAEQQTAQTAYSQAVTQLDAATNNVATQTAIVSNRQTQLTGQQATLTSLQKQYDAALKLRPRNTPLEKSLKTQISSIKTQITTTNTQLTAAKQTLAISLQAHTAAQNTVTAKKAILEGKDATLQQAIDGKTLLQTQEAVVVANIGNADMQLSQLQANTAETQSLRRAVMANIAATEHRITDLESEQADGRSALDAYAGQSAGAMSALQSAARAHENVQIALQSNANALQNNDRELQEVTTATAFRSATIHTMQTTLRDLASQREEQTGALQTLEADIREKRAAQDAIFSSLASTRSALDEALEALATHIVERDQRQADAAAASHDLSIALEEDRVVDETLATIERIDAALDAREAQDAMVQSVLRAIREADVTPSFRSLGDEALRAAAQSSAPVSFSAALGTADGRVSLDAVGGFLTVSRAEGGKVSLATLDLAGAHTKVTAVSGQAPGASSVAVFRGTRQLAELPLGNDGSFSYADTEGITAVLVGSRTTTAVNITSFSATADPLAEQPEGAALKPMTSRYAAQYQKPTFTPSDNYDYGVKTRTLQHYGIRQYSGGDNYNGTYMHAVNTSAYTVFRLRVNSGDVRFSKAQYMREDQGLIDLDRRYYEISPDGRQIRFAPGTPKHIVLSSGGNGSASYEMKEGENLADLLPPDRAVVDLSWQKLYATGPEGVFAGENGITESASAPFMEGDSVNVMYSIENSGGAGGNVTVDFHVGYTGDPAQDAKQKSFTVSAAAGSYQFLRANLSAPPAPAAGMHPIITYVIRYPDGSMGTGHKLGNPLKLNNMDYRTYDPVSGKLVWHAKDLTPEQERAVARATDKALAALASGQYASDPKVQLVFNAHPGLRETIAAHFGSAAVLSDATEETLAVIAGEHLLQEAMPAAMELHSDDPAVQAILDGLTYGDLVAVAGASDSEAQQILRTSIQRNALKTALSLYDPSYTNDIHMEFDTRNDTWAGKIFLGAVQEHARGGSMQRMASAAETALGISAKTIVDWSSLSGSIFARNLRRLFEHAGYDYLFSSPISPFPALHLSGAYVDQKHYNGGVIKLNWDLPADVKPEQYLHANIYLIDAATGAKIDDEALPIGGNIAGLSASIPASKLESKGIPSVAFKIVLWKEGEPLSDGLKPRSVLLSEWFTMKRDGVTESQPGSYSTNPNPDVALMEDKILSWLADKENFPIRNLKAEGWYWNIASPYHDGPSMHAVDLTISGNGDHGKPVYAPAEGRVIAAGTDGTHTVILEHMLPTGEVWYSKHLHMEQIGIRMADGSLKSLSLGDIVPDDSVFGLVSDIGSPGQYHYHGEYLLSVNGPAIDMRKVLMGHGILVYAEDAGVDGLQLAYADNTRLLVAWDEGIAAWVTSDANPNNPHLILDRSTQSGTTNVSVADSNQYWVAHDERANLRARVALVNDPQSGIEGWFAIDEDGSFLKANGKLLKWNGSNFVEL